MGKKRIIETRRLILRELNFDDAEAVFDMRSNDNVNRYIVRSSMENIEDAISLIQKTLEAERMGHACAFAAIRKNGKSQIIGTCGLTDINHSDNTAELGGEMAPEYWGNHLALEAVSAIVHYGFDNLNLKRVIAKFDSDNRGVTHLLQILGFSENQRLENHFEIDGTPKDLLIYTLDKSDFKSL